MGVVFTASEFAGRARGGRVWVSVLAGLTLSASLAATLRQVGYWRNSETLFRHAVAVTPGNFVAYNNLGDHLYLHGKTDEAMRCFREAVFWQPTYADAHCSLAISYQALRQPAEARAEFQLALRLDPKNARNHYFWANQLLAAGEHAGARKEYEQALALRPDYS